MTEAPEFPRPDERIITPGDYQADLDDAADIVDAILASFDIEPSAVTEVRVSPTVTEVDMLDPDDPKPTMVDA